MKRLFFGACLLAMPVLAQQTTTVSEFVLAGPYAVLRPFAADTVDVQGKKFDIPL